MEMVWTLPGWSVLMSVFGKSTAAISGAGDAQGVSMHLLIHPNS